jgi:ribosomal protein S18 acetylase RimI-like enzyme
MDTKITELELVAAELWQAPVCDRLGSWLLRAAEGFTGRANSALPLGDPGLPLPAAVAAVTEWYRSRDLPPMVVIPAAMNASPGPAGSPGAGGDLDVYLASRGWTVRSGAAFVMTAPAGSVAAGAVPVAVRVDTAPDEAWCALYHYRGADLPPIAHTLLMSAPWQGFASIRDADGSVIATGRVAVAGDWASLTAVEVAPAHRRRGLGVAITATLCRSAADRGARHVLLQVETGNAPAQALYARCGFRPVHRYHYRVAPAA